MHYRRLGRTGLEISEVGYGAWGIGKSQWIGAQDDESLRALRRAIELGLNFIDTALAYGEGHSEQLVGQVVRDSPETIYVATKVPPKNLVWPAQAGTPVEDTFPGDHVRRCAERSLRNLGTDTIDLLQLHVWDDGWADQGDWLETLHALRDEGKIRFFGISINDHEPHNGLRLVRGGVIDTVQVIYNAFDQSPEDELLPACATSDVGVIARVPFDEGGLTGSITPDTTFPEDDFRATYFKGDRKREVSRARPGAVRRPGRAGVRHRRGGAALRPQLAGGLHRDPRHASVRNVERNMGAADGEGLGAVQVEQVADTAGCATSTAEGPWPRPRPVALASSHHRSRPTCRQSSSTGRPASTRAIPGPTMKSSSTSGSRSARRSPGAWPRSTARRAAARRGSRTPWRNASTTSGWRRCSAKRPPRNRPSPRGRVARAGGRGRRARPACPPGPAGRRRAGRRRRPRRPGRPCP
jgi:aryl-alcohol dehydrogenase-like predicted oxidoreductase